MDVEPAGNRMPIQPNLGINKEVPINWNETGFLNLPEPEAKLTVNRKAEFKTNDHLLIINPLLKGNGYVVNLLAAAIVNAWKGGRHE